MEVGGWRLKEDEDWLISRFWDFQVRGQGARGGVVFGRREPGRCLFLGREEEPLTGGAWMYLYLWETSPFQSLHSNFHPMDHAHGRGTWTIEASKSVEAFGGEG